jgi:hypothetical protein
VTEQEFYTRLMALQNDLRDKKAGELGRHNVALGSLANENRKAVEALRQEFFRINGCMPKPPRR